MWFFLLFFIVIIVRHRFFWKINKDDMDKKYGVLFAHRGITKNYPENTLNAYLDAVKFGYKAIELDVVVSKDKQLICSHNHDLEYETNGKGKFKDFDIFDLKELKTGIYSHPKNTQQICTLKEVLKTVPVDVFLNIELKTEYWNDLKIAKILNDYRKKGLLKHKYIVSSFNPFLIFYMKFFTNIGKVGFLIAYRNWLWMINWIHPDMLHPSAELLDNSLLNFCKKKNLLINTWTVNNKSVLDYCKKNKINGVITDFHKPLLI